MSPSCKSALDLELGKRRVYLGMHVATSQDTLAHLHEIVNRMILVVDFL